MSNPVLWVALLAACLAVAAIKLVGHLLPEHWLAKPEVARIAALVTVALLSALVAVQAATTDGRVVLDARLGGIAAAVVALMLRAPFIVVVAVAALGAALLRWAGLP